MAGSWRSKVADWFNQLLPRAPLGFQMAADNFIRNYALGNDVKTTLGSNMHCNLVLFCNTDYTNINFIGFCAVPPTFVSICSLSYLTTTLVGKVRKTMEEVFVRARLRARTLFRKSAKVSLYMRNYPLSFDKIDQ